MVADLGHQLHKDDLVDAWEDLRIHQIGDLELHKALRQLQLVLRVLRDGVDVPGVLAVHPVGDEVVAVGLMWRGNEHLEPRKELLPHRSGGGGQQQMLGELRQVCVHVLIPGALRDHFPEDVIDAIVDKLLIDGIAVPLEPGLQHRFNDCIRLGVFQTGQRSQDGQL